MELRQIRYFVILAEELHFGRAAARIPIAQSALSQQIKKLEDELNSSLFYRDKHQVVLTEVGKVFWQHALRILQTIKETETAVSQLIDGEYGTLNIAFVEAALWDIIPRLISSYKQKHPNVEIIPHQMNTHMQIEALSQDWIQLGIVGAKLTAPDIHYYPIREERCLLALSPNHPLSEKKSVDIKDLAKERFVAIRREAGTFYFDQFIQTCMENGFSPNIVLTADRMQSLMAFVASNMGVALIHESSRNIRSDLRYLEVDGIISSPYQLFFAWKNQKNTNTLAYFLKEAFLIFPKKT
ncbi:LysR family transcriptional regulator [Enterococcus florum]|uniref:LysR family transcriptional regulator n=1 Tax=Enterococcus florum TaxID=2480627 RepID=A0A4P5PE26_9ENTE|nr:LysR family transcriptional regulator [Enterococcus florum]GCF94358.1 LysR family transcriptional regulator [Enterococcus florum]